LEKEKFSGQAFALMQMARDMEQKGRNKMGKKGKKQQKEKQGEGIDHTNEKP